MFHSKMQTAMLSLRKIIRAHFPQSTEPSINKMPPELLYMIFPLLDVPDQICFALTCKGLLACFEFFLKSRKTQLSQLAPFPQWKTLHQGFSTFARTQLLVQLQNEHWEYCSGCWTLHPRVPRTSRRVWEFCKRFRHRKRRANDHVLDRRDCTTRARSEVDLCPCLTLAFGDRLLPKQDIKAVARSSFDSRTRSYTHKCSFSSNPTGTVYIFTTVFLEDTGSAYRVVNNYRFEPCQPDNRGALHSTVPNSKDSCVCPVTQLRRFFQAAGWSFHGWGQQSPVPVSSYLCIGDIGDPWVPWYISVVRKWKSDRCSSNAN